MNELIEILYLVTSFSSLVASIPQLRQICVTKRSDELNISTWCTWVITQAVFLLYVLSRGENILLLTSTLWLLFYLVMASLILYYRKHPGHQAALEQPGDLDQ